MFNNLYINTQQPTLNTAQEMESNNNNLLLMVGDTKKQKKNTNLGPNTSCINCGTNKTSVWRRSNDKLGSPICNACGLYEKLHHSRRPLGMRKDSVLPRRRKQMAQRRNKAV